MTISKTISTIQKAGASLSLRGSLSLPLAVVVAVVETVSVSSVSQSIVSTIQKVRVSLSLGGSLSLPLAVVVASVKTVAVAKTVAVSPQSTIQKVRISLSLGGSLSLSLPLAVVEASVAKTVATVAVAKTVAKTVVVGISLCLGFRFSGSDGCKSENYEQFHVECRMSRSQLCSHVL